MKKQAHFNRVIIALDGSGLDKTILRYSTYFLKSFELEHIFLVHVSPNLALPKEILSKYQEVLAPKEEQIEKYLMELFKAEFKEHQDKVKVVPLEGEAFDQILRQAHIKDADLLILGRHRFERDHNLIGSRLVEQGPCSVLLVPDQSVSEISEILVPLDFSDKGRQALSIAQELSENLHADLNCLHLYHTAPSYLKNASGMRELNEALRDHSYQEWQSYLKKYKLPSDLNCIFLENQGDGPERCLFKAENIGADLIMLSSKGRTSSASILLGSFCKELVRLNKKIPLFVQKEKGENLDFFKALQAMVNN